MIGVGWWLGRGSARAGFPEYQPITFRTGSIGNARFTPDGSIVYSASWDGGASQLYVGRTDDPGARELGIKDAEAVIDLKEWESWRSGSTRYITAVMQRPVRWRGFR